MCCETFGELDGDRGEPIEQGELGIPKAPQSSSSVAPNGDFLYLSVDIHIRSVCNFFSALVALLSSAF